MNVKRKALAVAMAFGSTLDRMMQRHMARTGLLCSVIPYEVDDISTIPEALRPEYVELTVDGKTKYRAKLDGVDPEGLKKHVKDLNDENAQRRREAKEIAEKYKDVDPVKYREWIDKLDKDEDMKLRSEGKHEEANRRLTERMTAQHKQELDARDQKIAAAAEKVTKVYASYVRKAIAADVAGAGVFPDAVGDAVTRAVDFGFQYDEATDSVVLKDQAGNVALGKDGKTPLTPREWAETELKAKAAFMFPAGSTGGGAGGNTGKAPVNGSGMANLSPTQRLTAARAQRAARR